MQKLVFILLASLAIFTYIRALDAQAENIPQTIPVEIEH